MSNSPIVKWKRVQCRNCMGKGWVDCWGEETCSSCMGSGRDTKSNSWNAPCKKCNGSGKVSVTRCKCNPCDGKGYVFVPDPN